MASDSFFSSKINRHLVCGTREIRATFDGGRVEGNLVHCINIGREGKSTGYSFSLRRIGFGLVCILL